MAWVSDYIPLFQVDVITYQDAELFLGNFHVPPQITISITLRNGASADW